ncbi:FkbM family methyltransferase [Roseomonas marmotae]|uniref:FkbM family methyltransferase n=1 Tax=Roseomonas marmotae TaxID=2768161 RepID=A0ABS3K7H3_9PROT|nr:FkbM family methyltransferase [Roseomonas marmotae]MBO1073423.1 FkbM family methyltransferase [Roseomonas marmotae]
MTFISYAQNGEDVILWRALKQVERGFYIDVGACDPTEDSVTRAFYERGWSGINIEPSREYFELYAAARPRDRNLNLAVAAEAGQMRFMNVPGTGLSTLHEDLAAAAARGWTVEEREVRAMTLAQICAEAAPSEIHFLKIDVEGAEQAVLEGADFRRYRPWVVVIEATRPLSTERSEAAWEDILLRADYERAFFDGVNLYFVAHEKRELLPLLAAPPNALDGYKPAALAAAEQRIEALSAAQAAAERQIEALSAARAEMEESQKALQRRIGEQEEQLREAAGHAREQDALLEQITKLLEQDGAAGNGDIPARLRAHLARNARDIAFLRRQAETLEQVMHLLDQVTHLLDQDGATGSGDAPARLRTHLAARAREIALLRRQGSALAQHRDSLLASTSWRLTAPLRKTRTAIRVIRGDPRQFMPLLLGNLRSLGRPASPTLFFSGVEDQTPAEVPSLPANYEELPHRDKLVAFLQADTRRRRQAQGGN